MFITLLMTALYSAFIIFTFNLLPYNWLSDYNTDISTCPSPKYISFTRYFFPIFLYSSSIIFCLSKTSPSILDAATGLVMILLLSHISLSDILYMIIPDEHVIFIFLISLLKLTSSNISCKLLGILAGALPFVILLIVGMLFKKEECIGFGDIKLMSALGFFLGYENILHLYILSCLLSGIALAILSLRNILLKRNNLSNFVPFAPFISFSYIFCSVQ